MNYCRKGALILLFQEEGTSGINTLINTIRRDEYPDCQCGQKLLDAMYATARTFAAQAVEEEFEKLETSTLNVPDSQNILQRSLLSEVYRDAGG